MGELGTWLRETREARGLSLEQIEAQTRIRRTFLQALEEDDYAVLPGEVYVRGFLRNYAQFLGLDLIEVHDRYDQERLSHGLEAPSEDEHGYSPIDAALEGRRYPIIAVIRRSLLGLLILVVVGAVAAWYWWYDFALPQAPSWWPSHVSMPFFDAGGPQYPATTEPVAATVVPASPTATTAPIVAATSAVLPLPIPTSLPKTEPSLMATPAPTLRATQPIQLSVQVFERAWMQVTVDGEVDVAGILEAGDERTWVAGQTISLRCGNAGGVLVTVNGEELGSLGERGQVIEWTWIAQDDRIAVITPSPS